MYDVIIIGGGPAGLAAAIYTCRKNLKTLILTLDFGGQTNLTADLENYPGYEGGSGLDLMKKFEGQAKKFGAEIKIAKVEKVRKEKGGFSVELGDEEKFSAKTIILAYGKVPKSLNIPGEDEHMGKGVSTCVICDAPLFKGKTVAVVGGGNSAVEGAIELAGIAKKVYLIHRRDQFRADESSIEKIKKEKNVELVLSSTPKKINGKKFVKSITVENLNTQEKRELEVDGVFIEIGYVVDNSMIKDIVDVNRQNEVVINEKCQTSCKGIFAAGDVTTVPFKQTVIAAGDGAKAALQVHAFLRGIATSIDWVHSTKKK
ncbi:thioredoxin-disulfide reductase [Candidatus Woesearchaeota archaeon]|nr:thioredoxin-disulfide reductase [Candidatus Woesearchaeota archaeon]